MGKICNINGQPYLVSLPTGGNSFGDKNNQWNDIISFLGENCDDIFHWSELYSWCEEAFGNNHIVRGYNVPLFWFYKGPRSSGLHKVGFRPVFQPLNPKTLKPDPSLLEDIPDGSRFAFASLYVNGEIIPNLEPVHLIDAASITIGDRGSKPRSWIRVIKYKDLLWADQNILRGLSWEDLNAQGYTAKKAAPACPLCGKPMVLRMAKKGVNKGSPFWGCSGYPQCKGTRNYY